MGKIRVHQDSVLDLTVFTADGMIGADDVATAVETFYRNSVTLNVLWDLSGADVSRIEGSDIERIVSMSVPYGQTRVGGKTAVVATEDLTFGLSRVYEMLKDAEQLPFQTGVFRSMDEARAWLSE